MIVLLIVSLGLLAVSAALLTEKYLRWRTWDSERRMNREFRYRMLTLKARTRMAQNEIGLSLVPAFKRTAEAIKTFVDALARTSRG